jgi:Flp pilus assembly protein TadD
MMDFRSGSAKKQRCVAWALAALLVAAGCSQNRWFLGKSEAPGEADPSCGAAAPSAQGSGGATDLKNPSTMARLCESRGQIAEAKRLYEETIQRHPQDPAGYHGLALLHAKQGQFKEAEPCFARALALAPNRADLLGDMGYFYYLCSRNQEAERCLRRALELEPNQPAYGNNLALALGEQGRDQESLDLFRRFGTEEQACANMAFVYAQRGQYANALEMYDRVLTRDPKDRTAAAAVVQLSRLQDPRQRAGWQLAGGSPPPAVASLALPPTTVAPSAGQEPAPSAADSAVVRATPSEVPGDGGSKPTLRPAAAACTQVSAEVDSAGEATSSAGDVRWPEGALDVDRSR